MTRWMPCLLLTAFAPALAPSQAPSQAPALLAQPATAVVSWTHQLVGDITANQVALKDWAKGGDNALTWGLSLNGTTRRAAAATSWDTGYKLALGQSKLGDRGVRKTVDRFEAETALKVLTRLYADPYLKVTFKTQFFRGYKYEGDARSPVSAFVDPAYLTQSAGAGIQPWPQVETRAGVALREIVTRDFNSYADDRQTAAVEKVRVDGGLESVTALKWQLADNTLLTSKLEVFVPLTEAGDTSAGNDAALAVKLSQYITLNVNLQILNDPTSSADVQLKQTTAMGLSYSLF